LGVELRKLRAFRGQLVEVWRLDVGAAVESDIFPAQIVGNDMDDVRFARSGVGVGLALECAD
jgi:hypothetical protein